MYNNLNDLHELLARNYRAAFKHLILSRCMVDNYLGKDGGGRGASEIFIRRIPHVRGVDGAAKPQCECGWCPRAIIKSGVKVAPRTHPHTGSADRVMRHKSRRARARAAAAD